MFSRNRRKKKEEEGDEPDEFDNYPLSEGDETEEDNEAVDENIEIDDEDEDDKQGKQGAVKMVDEINGKPPPPNPSKPHLGAMDSKNIEKKQVGSVIESEYTDMYEADDLSVESANSPNPYDVLLKNLSDKSNDKYGAEAEDPFRNGAGDATLLQTFGMTKFYLRRNSKAGKVGRICWCCTNTVFWLSLIAIILAAALAGATIATLLDPRVTLAPTTSPTFSPTPPTIPVPTESPTTGFPTKSPTKHPTLFPSVRPTVSPTLSPVVEPTPFPVTVTGAPVISPTASPVQGATIFPSSEPTLTPTLFPTSSPTKFPVVSPTSAPSPLSSSNAPTRSPFLENPCQFAPNANYRFCLTTVILATCVDNPAFTGDPEESDEFIPGPDEELTVCSGTRHQCRCQNGLPFLEQFGCARPQNVGKFCPETIDDIGLREKTSDSAYYYY